MNRKVRRRAIWLLERRRLLRDAANDCSGADALIFSLAYGSDRPAIGNDRRHPYRELQAPSER